VAERESDRTSCKSRQGQVHDPRQWPESAVINIHENRSNLSSHIRDAIAVIRGAARQQRASNSSVQEPTCIDKDSPLSFEATPPEDCGPSTEPIACSIAFGVLCTEELEARCCLAAPRITAIASSMWRRQVDRFREC